MGVVGDGRYDEVGAVDCNHCRLCKTGPGVILLDEGVDTHDGDSNAEDEVEGDKELIQRAPRTSEVRIKQTCENYGAHIHETGGANQDPLPQVRRGRVLPVFKTSLRPRVGEVNEEDETK